MCVSEKCHLLQESEHMTKAMVRLRNVSELGSSGRSGKILHDLPTALLRTSSKESKMEGKMDLGRKGN